MMRFFAQCQAQAKLSGSVSSHVVITDPSAGAYEPWFAQSGWCMVYSLVLHTPLNPRTHANKQKQG